MPHLEIKYSNDIDLDVNVLFEGIEALINVLDPSAGVCKSRAYPSLNFRNSHVMVDLWLLPKPHRDSAFTQSLLNGIKGCVMKQIPKSCYVSLQLYYRDANYLTIE